SPLFYQWQFGTTNITGATNASFVLTNLQSPDAGEYSIVVSNAFGILTNAVYKLAVTDSPPVIFEQPKDQAFRSGGNVALRVLAYGNAPMFFQWWHDDALISGATNSLLTLMNLQTAAAGSYFVTISNAFGSTNSTHSVLSVGDPYPGQVDWPQL